MKTIIFDAGPIINFAVNSMLDILPPLKNKYGGNFLITQKVKQELVNKPISGLKFKFEALRTMSYINNGTLEVIHESEIDKLAKEFKDTANLIFRINNKAIPIIHDAESQAIAAAIVMGAEAVVIDETTARVLIEDPKKYIKIIERRMHSKVNVDRKKLEKLKKMTSGVVILRSTELAVIAYLLGLFDKYNPHRIPESEKTLLSSILWGLKLNGCSITEKEIQIVVNKVIKSSKK